MRFFGTGFLVGFPVEVQVCAAGEGEAAVRTVLDTLGLCDVLPPLASSVPLQICTVTAALPFGFDVILIRVVTRVFVRSCALRRPLLQLRALVLNLLPRRVW